MISGQRYERFELAALGQDHRARFTDVVPAEGINRTTIAR